MKNIGKFYSAIVFAGAVGSSSAHASNWSDTSAGIRYGNGFREPNNPNEISKTIIDLTHVSGDNYGRNLFVVDFILSDKDDPALGGDSGAVEVYAFYKRYFSTAKLFDLDFGSGFIKDVNIVARYDQGTKNSAMASRPQKFRAGLSADINIPKGFLEFGVEAYHEKNHNGYVAKEVDFDPTFAISSAWGIPLGPGSFSGYIDFVGAQGKDGFGIKTKPSTLMQVSYMVEIADGSGLEVGVGYEYWKNKYSNDNQKDLADGSTESVGLIMARYHF